MKKYNFIQSTQLTNLYKHGFLTESEFNQHKKATLVTNQPVPVEGNKINSILPLAGFFAIILVSFLAVGGYFSSRKSETRTEHLDRLFSPFDGSNAELEKSIKARMNDSCSYMHLETRYKDNGSTLDVVSKFRDKNATGGLVIDSALATLNSTTGHIIQCHIIH